MEEKDTTYSSVWLFRKNGKLYSGTKDPIANMKNFRQTGGKYFSEFNPTIAENIINFWSEDGDIILDPFAGRTRCFVSAMKKRKYLGFEISKEVHDKIMPLMSVEEYLYKPELFNMDSFNIDKLNIPKIDFIFSCPPYWKLERYESCDGQLSDIKKYEDFLERYKQIMEKSIDRLKEEKYMCLVVGDFRRNKTYIPFHVDLIKSMEQNKNLKLHDVITIQNLPFNTAAFYFGARKKHKYTAKAHEYLLVWKKV